MTSSRPRWASRLLLVVGAVLASLALVAGHVNRNLLDGPTFADHVDELRRNDAVARQAGRSISVQLVRSNPDLIAVAPLIEEVAVGVAGGDALSGPVRRAASAAHVALTEPGADSVVLRLADAGAVVAGVLAAIAPDRVPNAADVSATLVSIGDQSFADATIAVARAAGVLAWLLPLAALSTLAAAVALAGDRWRAVANVGWAMAAAAGALALVLIVGGLLVRGLDSETLSGAVGRAGWDVFVRPLWWSVVGLAALGGAVTLTAGSAVPETVRNQGARLASTVLRRPTTRAGMVVRAAALAIVGAAAIVDPLGVVELLALLTGGGLIVLAIIEVAAIGQAHRLGSAGVDADVMPTASRTGRRIRFVGGGLALAILVLGLVVIVRPARDLEVAAGSATTGRCNGHAELCDRRFDEVAYVASHNAMSVAQEPGWFLAEQLDPIVDQLDQGVRVLLVDVWSGRRAGTVVRTAPSSYEEALAVTEAELGPDVVAAAGRVATAVAGEPEGPESRFLCHGLCETGSTPFLDTLVDLRGWLANNPEEVVTLFIEDHVDAALIAADVEASGLVPFLHQPVVGDPWPTLAEMVASDERLVIMIEEGNGGTDAPWLLNGFQHTQDTPYTFPTVESFSCATNRGPSDAPLLLLNHWLSGFSSLVTDAQLVNGRDVLLPRAEQCRSERGQIPNFVAVNFVTIGDVFAVVDTLNGVA